MSRGIRQGGSVLAVSLSGLLVSGGGSLGVQQARATDLPVTSLVTATSYSVTFSGDDADLSFEVNTGSLVALTSGAGWIPVATGGRASFGFVAGAQQDGTILGQLVYIDHDIGLRVRSTSITSFTPGCASTITGAGDSTFGPVNFVATVTDGGEPGTSDTFSIMVTTGVPYASSGVLSGGDIQAHGLTCP